MWSFGHILFMLAPFVFTLILHKSTRGMTQEKKRQVGIYLSIVAILILVARNLEIWIKNDFSFDHEILPLQVCHFANFVLLWAFWKKSDVAFSLAFTLNLLAAFLSIVFADGLENYTSILNARGFAYIFGHIIIVVITLWAFLNDFIFISLKSYIQSLIAVELMIVLSIFINNGMYALYGKYSNYFYTEHPESGTPLEWGFHLGKEYVYGSFKINYIYILMLMIVFPMVTFVLYNVAKQFGKAK
jgi:hypothetical protein